MHVGDPDQGDIDSQLMTMSQQHEGEVQDLMVAEKEYLNKEQKPDTNPSTAELGESKMQELSDEETETLLKQLDVKCEVETSSTKDKDELERNSGNAMNVSNYQIDAEIEESLEKGNRKNPLLLIPVIRCVLKFLSMDDLKTARLVCQEWGSTGMLPLASRALIRFHKCRTNEFSIRLPEDFQSCFLDWATLFSAFKISGHVSKIQERNSWTVEELTMFFDKQQKYIKELELQFFYGKSGRNIDMSPWISQSPMLQKDAKYVTKLWIEGTGENEFAAPTLNYIAHIQNLALTFCTIKFEAGIKICPTKLELRNVTFLQNGVKLRRIRINDILDLGKTKEISLDSLDFASSTKYVVDLRGNVALDKLILEGVEIENGEVSQWVIEHLATTAIPYSLNSQMKIKELFLSEAGWGIDLSTLPTSLQKLVLNEVDDAFTLSCSQPIELQLQNLQYLQITHTGFGFAFLSHFMKCPQLTFLKFYQSGEGIDINSNLIPRSIKTLSLEDCSIKWVGEPNDANEDYRKLEKLIVDNFKYAKELCEAQFHVDDFVVDCNDKWEIMDNLVDFLEYRKRLTFSNRLYVGNLMWGYTQLEESALKEYTDVKSSFYVFENGEKGRPISAEAFHQLFPKHIDVSQYLTGNAW